MARQAARAEGEPEKANGYEHETEHLVHTDLLHGWVDGVVREREGDRRRGHGFAPATQTPFEQTGMRGSPSSSQSVSLEHG